MSQHTPDVRTRSYSDCPWLVYANIGDEDNLIPVKQFASRAEAEAWIKLIEVERPGYYNVTHESEFGTAL